MQGLLLGLAFSVALSLPALAADARNITIINETGYEISFIGVNPPGDNDFDENEISTGQANGQSVYVKFNNADRGCTWNIKVKWTGYSEQVFFQNVNLCTIDTARLRYDRDTKETTALVQ